MTQHANPWAGLFSLANADDANKAPEMRRLTSHGGFNPRPKDTIRHGSATQAVLDFLRTTTIPWVNFAQIQHATGRTSKAIDHALLYLRALDLLETVRGADLRNGRYMRYQFKQGTPDVKIAAPQNPKARTRGLARDEVSLPEP